MSQAMSADRDLWKKRPLTQKLISYAAHGSTLAGAKPIVSGFSLKPISEKVDIGIGLL